MEERIQKSLQELSELLNIDNPIDIPYLRRDSFIFEMRDIIKTEMSKDTFNYANEVLHLIYKKKMGEHKLWLDTFELLVRDSLFLN